MENLSNKEQVELVKKWFKEYGIPALIAVVLGLGLGMGWRYYKGQKLQSTQSAAQAYQQLLIVDQAAQKTETRVQAQDLIKQYSSTVYASLAKLLLAKWNVADKQYAKAYKNLAWVFDNCDVAAYRQIARLRAARVLLQMKKPQQARHVLAKVDDKAFDKIVTLMRRQAKK